MTKLRALLAAATPGPWHRHTYGHSNITQIVRVLGKALRNGEWRSTDASFVHADGEDGEGPSVAFTGNGPRQTDNADLIAALVNAAPLMLDVIEAARQANTAFWNNGPFVDALTAETDWEHRPPSTENERLYVTMQSLRAALDALEAKP